MSTEAPPAVIRGLYAIADSTYLDAASFTPAVRAALDGGARVLQYRDKTSDPATRETLARELNALCRERGVPFLINDDVSLAAGIGAAGVHLGRDDPGIGQARAALGPHGLIGVSCYNDLGRARAAALGGADYVAFGRFFPSRTKPQAVPATAEKVAEAAGGRHIRRGVAGWGEAAADLVQRIETDAGAGPRSAALPDPGRAGARDWVTLLAGIAAVVGLGAL